MQFRFIVRAGCVLAAIAAVGVFATGTAFAHGHAHRARLFVSPSGSSGAADHNCHSAAYSSIQAAVNDAPAHARVVVCKGQYTESVVIDTPMALVGRRGAVIQGASSSTNTTCPALTPTSPPAVTTNPCLAAITIETSYVRVQHLKVTGAIGEGILATGSPGGGSINHIVIRHNRVIGNDQGSSSSAYLQCTPNQQVPGDCGEGIHLMSVEHSRVVRNRVTGNSGGVLLTDEWGPTDHNKVLHNLITENQYDCGVTLPSHNPNAVDSNGNPQPTMGGVYDNVVAHNRITHNGMLGEGAGVLIATPAAGTGSYHNRIAHNVIYGNDLSGVTMHAHATGSGPAGPVDMNDNVVTHNRIGQNNLGGDQPDPPSGATDSSYTGILVYSANGAVSERIFHNLIRHNDYGIWAGVGGNVTLTMAHNRFKYISVQNLFIQS